MASISDSATPAAVVTVGDAVASNGSPSGGGGGGGGSGGGAVHSNSAKPAAVGGAAAASNVNAAEPAAVVGSAVASNGSPSDGGGGGGGAAHSNSPHWQPAAGVGTAVASNGGLFGGGGGSGGSAVGSNSSEPLGDFASLRAWLARPLRTPPDTTALQNVAHGLFAAGFYTRTTLALLSRDDLTSLEPQVSGVDARRLLGAVQQLRSEAPALRRLRMPPSPPPPETSPRGADADPFLALAPFFDLVWQLDAQLEPADAEALAQSLFELFSCEVEFVRTLLEDVTLDDLREVGVAKPAFLRLLSAAVEAVRKDGWEPAAETAVAAAAAAAAAAAEAAEAAEAETAGDQKGKRGSEGGDEDSDAKRPRTGSVAL